MNQTTQQRLDQERLRRQANKKSTTKSTTRCGSLPITSHAYLMRAIAHNHVGQVEAWWSLHQNNNNNSNATALAGPQHERLVQTLRDALGQARRRRRNDNDDDKMIDLLLSYLPNGEDKPAQTQQRQLQTSQQCRVATRQ